MTHYNTLGVGEKATPDEIKKAFRKLASQHHPDKGGDTAKYQEIQRAYDILSDSGRRQQYDMERQGMGGFRFNVNGQDVPGGNGFDDILKNFGFHFNGDPFQHVRQPRRNKDLRISIQVTLASTLEEQKKTVSVQTTNGHRETVEVTIPRGVTSSTSIKYPGLGDNFFNTLPRGDLYVEFTILPQPNIRIEGLDAVTNATINCFDAITGTDIEVTGIDGKTYSVNVAPGTQPGTILRVKNQGIWQLNSSQRGNLLIIIHVVVPQMQAQEQLELINQLKNTL